MKYLIVLLFVAIPAATIAQDDSTMACIVGLSGYSAYKNGQFVPDKMSVPVVIQVSKIAGVSVVSVLGWSPGECAFVASMIVCAAEHTVETYLITDEGVVYFTKTTSNPITRGAKALVGRIGEC